MIISCEACNKQFYIRPSHFNRNKHHYCSRKCRGVRQKGKNNPAFKDSWIKICKYCGKEYRYFDSRGKKYCSRKCMGMANRNGYETFCGTCGKNIISLGIYKGTVRFCSRKCANTYHSKRMFGNGNSNWRGGIGKLPWSYEFSKALKEKVKQRDDNKCQLCGKKNVLLTCHHIDYDKENNGLDNLITLCFKCHGMVNYNRLKWKEELSNRLKK